ncbi:MAG TPA: DNA polymerase III subunit delta' [Burkholderiales bacterium]|nr:DNA polymerase III subunit delta' [Burkholderiales bacterium]
MSPIYPWQHSVWERVARPDLLPHALLIYGRQGIGKLDFARTLTGFLLCSESEKTIPCGVCASCHYLSQGSHPDFIEVFPLEEEGNKKASKVIKVEQVRDLGERVGLTTHQGGRRVVLVYPAEALNVNAANSLLKTLEEPNSGTYLILVSHRPGMLPLTVLSRCARLEMPLPKEQEALDWLEANHVSKAQSWLVQAGGGPLLALELSMGDDEPVRLVLLDALCHPSELNVVELAERIMHVDFVKVLTWIYKWVFDLLAALAIGSVRCHADEAEALLRLVFRIERIELARFAQKVIDRMRTVNHPLNVQLCLEELLLDYRALFVSRKALLR